MDDRQPILTEQDVLPFILGMIIGIVGGFAFGEGSAGIVMGIGFGAAIGIVMVIANREWGSNS